MRVLLVTDWNRGRGGAEAYLNWLRDGLRAAGDEVRVLTSSVGTAGDGLADYVAFGTEHVAAQVLLQIVNPFAAARTREAVRTFRPDVALVNMFAHHLSPAILFALGAVPTVLMVSDYKVICPLGSKLRPDASLCTEPAGWVCHRTGCLSLPHWLRDQPRYALIRAGMRRARRVVVCSAWMQRMLADEGIAADHVVLPVPSPGPSYRHVPAPEPTFVFVGRLDVEKGVAGLLRGFARVRREVPAARLRLVGRGPARAGLEQLAREVGAGEAVGFLGWLEPEGVEAQLADAWALVAPSLWAEPFGLVAPEAIVRGVPVVASAVGGLAESVEEGVSGLLFANGDESALAERLLAIARGAAFPQHELPSSVVARARDRHDVGRHVDGMGAILRQVVRRASDRDA